VKRTLITIFFITCSANAIEFSYRIQGLGTEFAYLIPDYETDLYRNPELLGRKILGIAYDRYWYTSTPLTLLFLLRGFGIYGEYWPDYNYELRSSNTWQSLSSFTFKFEDLWMLRIKNEVWNLYNDGQILVSEQQDSYGDRTLDRTIEYFLSASGNYKIGRRFTIHIKPGAGLYGKWGETYYYQTAEQLIVISSGRIGLSYRNAPVANRFSSWFIDFGGPVSAGEINELPYSIYLDMYEHDRKIKYFANSFILKIGWARGIPLHENSFVAIGLKDDFLYQRTEQGGTDYADTVLYFSASTNTFTFPIAVEYIINKISLRFVARLSYLFKDYRTSNDLGLISEDLSHDLSFGYSFGIGWQPHGCVFIDLYNRGNLSEIGHWSIYFKYLF